MRIKPPKFATWGLWGPKDHSLPSDDDKGYVFDRLQGKRPISDKFPPYANFKQQLHAPKVPNLADYVDMLYGESLD